jgi:hypothetical protein
MRLFKHALNGRMMVVAAGILGGAGTSAQGAFITDPGFFNANPSTLINFETDGMGNTISLIQGQTQVMPSGTYASLGVTLTGNGSPVYWVNDGNAAFDAAQTIGGSPTTSIPSSLTNSFTMTFSTDVKAFGFFVANNRNADAAGPVFVVRDTAGNIIETAVFSPLFVDGTITSPNTTADYGFMGVLSSVNIGSVTVTKTAAILDDLRFSPVPAPGVAAVGGLGVLMIGARRKRSR